MRALCQHTAVMVLWYIIAQKFPKVLVDKNVSWVTFSLIVTIQNTKSHMTTQLVKNNLTKYAAKDFIKSNKVHNSKDNSGVKSPWFSCYPKPHSMLTLVNIL